jgi:hypothetical protein
MGVVIETCVKYLGVQLERGGLIYIYHNAYSTVQYSSCRGREQRERGAMSVTQDADRPLYIPNSFTVEEAGTTPGKHSDTRIKPLPLAFTNGHGRYICNP